MSEADLVFELQCLQRSKARKRFRREIFEHWGGCAYCGAHSPRTLDHVKPKCKGGETTRANLVPACLRCNLAKSDAEFCLWFRSQTFWNEEREVAILAWVNQGSCVSAAAEEYERLREFPLLAPVAC